MARADSYDGRTRAEETVHVGSGAHRYEQIHTWGTLPDGLGFGKVSAVAVDSKDRVYLYQRDIRREGVPPIVVFESDGTFVRSWGHDLIGDGHGLFMSADDELYAVDRDGHQILKFSLEGELLLTLGDRTRPEFQAPFNHPSDVAVGPTGDIYVADGYGNSCVHRFSPDGELLQSWGRPGSGPGEFRVPHGIWVGGGGEVYVADRDNHRLQVFTGDGAFVEERTEFFRPTAIYVDPAGTAYVTELIPRVSIFDPAGELLARIRPANNNGHGVWADSVGDLYVAATDGPTLEKYVRQR